MLEVTELEVAYDDYQVIWGVSLALPLRFGRLEIDRAARAVRIDGDDRSLTSYQFDLLCTLAESAGRVLSREQLMNGAGRDLGEAFDRSIDVHISRIRAAIEDDVRHPRRVVTVRGAGYLFARKQDDEAAPDPGEDID